MTDENRPMTDENSEIDHFKLGNDAMQDNRLDAAIAEFKEALKNNAEFEVVDHLILISH
jgi:GGDEF domain-containing protein